jgi:hypothetical protein
MKALKAGRLSILAIMAFLVMPPRAGLAQVDSVTEMDIIATIQNSEPGLMEMDLLEFREPPLYRRISSLFFTYWQHEAIRDAKNSRGLARPPTEAELKAAEDAGPKTKPEDRDIRLGGIVYTGPKDWTIWLNEQRVTPDAIPPQVLDLRVYKHHIEIKWLDEYTNSVFPLRLRAHERFNLDTRIFLPG